MLLNIPTKPESLSKIKELIKKDCGINEVADVIHKDISLSATVIKIANTPIFSRGFRIDSIKQAASIIGIKRLETIAMHAALKNNSSYIGLDRKVLDVLWSHSELVAAACDLIAGRCYKEIRESAYIAGLFHDCAIPLFVKKFKGYGDHFLRSMRACDTSIILHEINLYKADHCSLGGLICEKWDLPEAVVMGVKNHHFNYEDINMLSDVVKSENFYMVAILVLADQLVQNIDTGITGKSLPLNEWAVNHKNIINVLGMTANDVVDLKEDFLDKTFT